MARRGRGWWESKGREDPVRLNASRLDNVGRTTDDGRKEPADPVLPSTINYQLGPGELDVGRASSSTPADFSAGHAQNQHRRAGPNERPTVTCQL